MRKLMALLMALALGGLPVQAEPVHGARAELLAHEGRGGEVFKALAAVLGHGVEPRADEIADLRVRPCAGGEDDLPRGEAAELVEQVALGVPGEGRAALQLLGFKIQFTQMRVDPEGAQVPFCTLERGWGIAEGSVQEGFRRGGLIATWLLGPIMPSNPEFTRWFCEKIAGSPVVLAFEDEARAAYDIRRAELTHPLPKGKTINP